MKPLLLVFLMSLASFGAETQYFYAPTPTALTGVMVRENGEGDPDREKGSWILRLPQPVTVNPNPGGQGGALETNVKELRLTGDADLLAAAAATKTSVTWYGGLSHIVAAKDSWKISMDVSGFGPVAPPVREIRRSPDGKMFVAWVDQDLGPPFDTIRSIFLRSATDPETCFSVVTSPRYTDAAWNPSSTRCVIADAPDNGGPRTWLVERKSPSDSEWQSRQIEPFRELGKQFYEADPEVHHLFRPAFSSIDWISETKVQFHASCNTGTYLLTIDTDRRDNTPVAEKLSDGFLKE
jgi:hypothetical protein